MIFNSKRINVFLFKISASPFEPDGKLLTDEFKKSSADDLGTKNFVQTKDSPYQDKVSLKLYLC